MPDSYIVEHCSPVLAGLKTGNMFTVRHENGGSNEEIRTMNQRLTRFGLRMIPLRNNGDSVLLYLYRPDRLSDDLKNPHARRILEEKGYPVKHAEQCVACVSKHLKEDEGFPHEIGLFLSYPPEDVQGFMEHPKYGVKCVGFWKVYGDEERAQRTFTSYRKCKDIYQKAIQNGTALEQLIVTENKTRKEKERDL
ncbi:MAG: DUF3793 family protein [Solobacterium sp.]|nr:DUF3793 family protein [Solobacterium sp.]